MEKLHKYLGKVGRLCLDQIVLILLLILEKVWSWSHCHKLNIEFFLVDFAESPENLPVWSSKSLYDSRHVTIENISLGELYYVSIMHEQKNGGKSAKLPDAAFISGIYVAWICFVLTASQFQLIDRSTLSWLERNFGEPLIFVCGVAWFGTKRGDKLW